MRFRAGSWPWLLAHEMRLAWRGFFSDNVGLMFALLLVIWLALHIPAAFAMRVLSFETLGTVGIQIAGFAFWAAFTLMLSSAVILSVNALYDRGDLDLLISSPLKSSTIFTVRGAGVALNSVALFAAFLLPFAHMGILRGQFGLIAIYPVLVAVGLMAAGLAFALSLLLVRLLGARRARVISQILSAIIGASLFLGLQLPNLVPDEVRDRWTQELLVAASSGWLTSDSLLWWPARAIFGDPLPAVATILFGTTLFVVVIRLTSRSFLSGTQESIAAPVRAPQSDAAMRFSQGLARNVMRKEFKLILRDPNLIAKTLLQALYLLPVMFLLARNNDFANVLYYVAPVAIVLLAGMAGNLAWITIAGEQAPDLIGSAPVNRERVRWLKAAAAVKPLLYLSAPFVFFLVLRSPRIALAFVVFLALALAAAAVTQVWGGKPSPDRDLKQRQKENVALNFVELLSVLALAVACYLTIVSSWWALALLPAGLLAPWLAWTMRQRDAV